MPCQSKFWLTRVKRKDKVSALRQGDGELEAMRDVRGGEQGWYPSCPIPSGPELRLCSPGQGWWRSQGVPVCRGLNLSFWT